MFCLVLLLVQVASWLSNVLNDAGSGLTIFICMSMTVCGNRSPAFFRNKPNSCLSFRGCMAQPTGTWNNFIQISFSLFLSVPLAHCLIYGIMETISRLLNPVVIRTNGKSVCRIDSISLHVWRVQPKPSASAASQGQWHFLIGDANKCAKFCEIIQEFFS